MIVRGYSVYDRQVRVYSRPFYALTDGEALRMLLDLAVDETTWIGKHPEDYSLFYIGDFDDSQGRAEGVIQPVLLDTASNVIFKKNGQKEGVK